MTRRIEPEDFGMEEPSAWEQWTAPSNVRSSAEEFAWTASVALASGAIGGFIGYVLGIFQWAWQ